MLSAKTEYSCLALARLAVEHASGQPVQGRRLAAEEGIPEGFLVQILQELKRLGLVTSTRGASGGYRLAREPEDLSLGEVLDLVDGPPSAAGCVAKPSPLGEAVAEALCESSRNERERLRGLSLAEVAAQATAPGGMYYI